MGDSIEERISGISTACQVFGRIYFADVHRQPEKIGALTERF